MKRIFLKTKYISSQLGDSFRIISDIGPVTPSFASRSELQSGVYLTVDERFSFITVKPLPGSLCSDYSINFYLNVDLNCVPDEYVPPALLCNLVSIQGGENDPLVLIESFQNIKEINC